MDFRELNYVIAIAEYQNLSKASEHLYVSQPTLTKFLKTLESQLGQPLFDRVGNKFVLNYAGKCFVEDARSILEIKSSLDKKLLDIRKENIGMLKIGVSLLRSASVLPQVLPEFSELYPKINIQLIEEDSSALEKMLINGDLDLAAYAFSARHPALAYEVINPEELILAMSIDHPLAKMGEQRADHAFPFFDIRLAADERFILSGSRQHMAVLSDRLFHNAGFKPHVVLVTKNKASALALAARGYGITLLKNTHLDTLHENLHLLKFFALEDSQTMSDFGVIYRANAYVPQYMRDFIRITKEKCSTQYAALKG